MQAITVIMGVVVGLTFLFGFGNVLNLALGLEVPVWVAPLSASADVLRPARRLLIFASVVTLALNVADPIVAGEYGKATFDAGWAEVGPSFLQTLGEFSSSTATRSAVAEEQREVIAEEEPDVSPAGNETKWNEEAGKDKRRFVQQKRSPEKLLDLAREVDAAHRAAHQKPISADTLRVQLGIGATQARQLVKAVRSEFQARIDGDQRLSSVPHDSERDDPVAA